MAFRRRCPGRAPRGRHELAREIRRIHAESDRTYGAPRITAELRDGDRPAVNEKRVARVMRAFGIVGVHLRRKARTTVPAPAPEPVPDLFGRDFTAPAPNRKYMGDITYLPVGDGEFLYLATVIDCHSRRVAGWSIADHMRTELVADALKAAAATRGDLTGAIFHSDHGAQYKAKEYAELCTELGVTRSMGAVGTSADNAACESFHASLKRELLQGARRFDGPRTCRQAVFRWLNRYNTWRRHKHNGQLSPIAYETQHAATLTLAA